MAEIHEKLFEDLGWIKGKLEGIDQHLKTLNGKVAEHEKSIRKTDVFFGKVGIIVTAIAFVATTIFTLFIDVVKSKVMDFFR